jgi:Mn-dependent DtxR family transcriptional regulator
MKAALDPQARRALRALYELAELDVSADAGLLARALDLRPAVISRVLAELDARGLVDAKRVRLTLEGLAAASRVPSLRLATSAWLSAHLHCMQLGSHRQVS